MDCHLRGLAQLTINIGIQKNTAVSNDTFVLLRPIQTYDNDDN